MTNLSRRSKEPYFKNLFEENKKNTYKIWQEIKVLINRNTETKYAPIYLQIKESIVTDSKVIANEFNNFFNFIASNIDSKIIQTKTNFQDTLKNQKIQMKTPFLYIQRQKKKLKIIPSS